MKETREERYTEADREAELVAEVLREHGMHVETARSRDLTPLEDRVEGDLFIVGTQNEQSFDLKTTSGPNYRIEKSTLDECRAKFVILTREFRGEWDVALVPLNDAFRKHIRETGLLREGTRGSDYYLCPFPEQFASEHFRVLGAFTKDEALWEFAQKFFEPRT